MGRIETISIDAQMEEFVDEQVRGGHYGSVEEVVGAALRMLRHQAEIEAIEAAIAESEESGPPRPFDFDAFIEAKRARRG